MLRKVLFGLLGPLSLFADKWISLGGGVFGIVRPKDRTAMIQVEYQPSPLLAPTSWFHLTPQVGAFANLQGAFYAYGGLRFEFIPTSWLMVTPGFAIGLYERGHSKKLHFPWEYKSSFELAFPYRNNTRRFSAQFYHISNGSMGNRNPGTEAIVFSYVFKL